MAHLRRVPIMGDDATTFTEQGYYSVPRVYIRNSLDMTIKPQYQDLFISKNPPNEVLHIDSDHSPFLSAEKDLHQHLLHVAETYSKWILLPSLLSLDQTKTDGNCPLHHQPFYSTCRCYKMWASAPMEKGAVCYNLLPAFRYKSIRPILDQYFIGENIASICDDIREPTQLVPNLSCKAYWYLVNITLSCRPTKVIIWWYSCIFWIILLCVHFS